MYLNLVLAVPKCASQLKPVILTRGQEGGLNDSGKSARVLLKQEHHFCRISSCTPTTVKAAGGYLSKFNNTFSVDFSMLAYHCRDLPYNTKYLINFFDYCFPVLTAPAHILIIVSPQQIPFLITAFYSKISEANMALLKGLIAISISKLHKEMQISYKSAVA